jgi:transposase
VHKDQIAVAILDETGSVFREFRVGGESRGQKKLERELAKLSVDGSLECAYEAGPTGYGLQRRLTAAGFFCQVVAPSLIPRKPGDRIKTDRRDAKKLAELLRGGQLTAVCPPTPEQEAVRDLCRCRSDARDDLMRARHRLDKMLLRRGLVYREGGRWTLKHRRWLLKLEWATEADRLSFGSYLRSMESCEDRMQDLDAALEAESRKEPYLEPVGWLRCFRGFDTVNAMTVVTELHNVARFDSPRKLMAYLGLVPSEDSTGNRIRRGGITKAGNGHVRRAMINAARHYRSRPHVGRALSKRREGQPQPILALADRAQHRLHRRYLRLAFHRELNRNKAVTAVARELTGFVWAALREAQGKEHTR